MCSSDLVNNGQPQQRRSGAQANGGQGNDKPVTVHGMPRRKFPARQVPDTEANDTKARQVQDKQAY